MISQNTHDTHETNTMSTVFRPQHSPGFSGKVVDLPWSDHTTYFFFDSCWHKSRDAVKRAEEVWLDHLGRNPRRGEAVLHARCLDFIARAQLNLSVLGCSFVVFHDKTKRTQQGNLLYKSAVPFEIEKKPSSTPRLVRIVDAKWSTTNKKIGWHGWRARGERIVFWWPNTNTN